MDGRRAPGREGRRFHRADGDGHDQLHGAERRRLAFPRGQLVFDHEHDAGLRSAGGRDGDVRWTAAATSTTATTPAAAPTASATSASATPTTGGRLHVHEGLLP